MGKTHVDRCLQLIYIRLAGAFFIFCQILRKYHCPREKNVKNYHFWKIEKRLREKREKELSNALEPSQHAAKHAVMDTYNHI